MTADTQAIPCHVGLILDGNRRWAKGRGLPSLKGHRQGMEVLKDIAYHAFDQNVQYLSAYIFSTENWNRTEEEVGYLMDLTVKAMEKYLDEFHKKGIKVLIVGSRNRLQDKVLQAIENAENRTAHNTDGTLALCFNYGGRQEIVDAVKSIVADGTAIDDVDESCVTAAMYHPEIPDVDLLIRTSGELRTSGYMLYRAAYAELYFTDVYWPDFTSKDFDKALNDYASRGRRFGA